jgi:anti-sigma regulatory factor (Ser/Thr protein kinase)
VTNSIRHSASPAQTSIEQKVEALPDRVRVEVGDRGPGFEPTRRPPDRQSASGWGLYLVDQLSDRWGVSRTGTTRVWFEVDR